MMFEKPRIAQGGGHDTSRNGVESSSHLSQAAKSMRHSVLLAIMAMVTMMIALITPLTAQAANYTIVKDDFEGVNATDVVILTDKINIDNVTITTTRPDIYKWYINKDHVDGGSKQKIIYANAPLPSANLSSPASVPGSVTLKFDKAAVVDGGEYLDVVVTLSNIKSIGEYGYQPYTGTQMFTIAYLSPADAHGIGEGLWLSSGVAYSNSDAWKNKMSSWKYSNMNGTIGTQYNNWVEQDVEIKLLKTGTSEPYNSTWNLAMRDLDQPQSFNHDLASYDIRFCEGIAPISGFQDIHVSSNTLLKENGTYISGTTVDEHTFNSGLIASVPASGVKFTWHASEASTWLFDHKDAGTITATVNGSETEHVGGSITSQGKVNTSYKNNYTYKVKPDSGYQVKKVTVDGTDVTDTVKANGNKYVFSGVTTDHAINVDYEKATVSYTVNHINKGETKPFETENKTGTAGGKTTAEAKSFNDKKALPFDQETIKEDGSTIVNIYYEPYTWNIAFDKNAKDATGTTANINGIKFGETKNLTQNGYTRPGYEFKGWTAKADGTGTTYTDKQAVKDLTNTPDATVTLYAKWDPIDVKYIVNHIDQGSTTPFDTENKTGKTGTQTQAQTKTFNTKTALPFDQETIKGDGTTIVDIYYEPYTWNIAFNKNAKDATGTTANINGIKFGETKNLTQNGYTRPGYVFQGWTTKADGTGTAYTDKQAVKDLTQTPDDTITLYAKWAPAEVNYKVQHVNKATDKLLNEETKTGTNGQMTNATPNEYKGLHPLTPVEQKTIKADGSTIVTIYYEPNAYRILFDKNAEKATGEMTPQEMEYDKEDNLKQLAFSYDGYEFTGWNIKPDNTGDSYSDGAEVVNLTTEDNGEVTLYAQWKPKEDTPYKVTHTIEGEPEPFAVDEKTGTTGELTESQPRSVTGYHNLPFEEKEIAADGSTVVNITYVANKYQIAFDKNHESASGEMPNQEMEYDVPENLDKMAFENNGWKFIGWNDKADGSGLKYEDMQEVVNLTAEDNGVVTLFAQWEHIKVTVTYVDGHASEEIGKETVNQGDDGSYPEVPEHVGYVPVGWDKEPLNVQEDMTITVSYRPAEYVIRFDKGAVDARGVMPDQGMVYDVPESLDKMIFERDGFVFIGWMDLATGTEYSDMQEVVNLTAEDGGVVTLTALWEPAPQSSEPDAPAPKKAEPVQQKPVAAKTIAKTGDIIIPVSMAVVAALGGVAALIMRKRS